MSSMTEEQKQEYQYITERWMHDSSYSIGDSIDWLNRNHFDYRGLIPAGDAIDATGKRIYPYVKKETVEDESIRFPYPIGSRVKIKIANKDRFATIVGISYNTFGNKQYEIIIDKDNPLIKIHYPTDLMTLI